MPLDITEYSQLAVDSRGFSVPTGREPSTRVQQVAVGVSAAASDPLQGTTCFVRVHTDTTCRLKFSKGGDPADATCQRLPAGATEFYGVTPGTPLILSVIQSA